MQAGFKPDQVSIEGRHSGYSRISDEADAKEHVFHFCPECGSSVVYTEPTEPDLIVVSVGSFADPSFPPPTESGYDSQRHAWVVLPDTIMRGPAPELWDPVRPLYEAGEYAEAADRGLRVIEANPGHPDLYFKRRVLREPRRADGGRARAPRSRDRDVRRMPGDGEGRLGLRPDSRQAGVRRARRPLAAPRIARDDLRDHPVVLAEAADSLEALTLEPREVRPCRFAERSHVEARHPRRRRGYAV